MADAAMAAVTDGRIRIIPAMWEKTFFEWMNNIRDWCISRQIWWGHRIPAWYCQDCGEVIVARETPPGCPKCLGSRLVQEEDVLDTWFSSALWPFSTLGWPEETKELHLFYPTSVLITAFDILFFWVARMMMMGLYFMQDVPFREVYIHALVRDAEGQKMSKSKGNVVDPLEVMDQFGTDAFRFSLAAFAAMGRDVRLSEDRIAGYRNFVNKIWNASRFTLMNLADFDAAAASQDTLPLTVAERWIVSRLQQVSRGVAEALDSYNFDQAAHQLYQFAWHEFCDWYLELIKPALYDSQDPAVKRHTQKVLQEVLSALLRLLHPFMPFVTEEIWHKLPAVQGSIMVAPFPVAREDLLDPAAEADMTLLMAVITSVRNLRGEMNIPPGSKVPIKFYSPNQAVLDGLAHHSRSLEILAKIDGFAFNPLGDRPQAAAKAVVEDVEIYLPLAGLIDFAEEDRRLTKEMDKIGKDLTMAQRKLANEDFMAKAPAEVVAKEKERVQTLTEKMAKLKSHKEKIKTLTE
jgi:valyl-tRNA synthetase